MNSIPEELQIEIFAHLADGCSLNSTSRLVGVHRLTVMSWLRRFGEAAQALLQQQMQQLNFCHLQVDEMWTYVYCKQAKVSGEARDIGDQYLWIGIDTASKLIPTFHVGKRTDGDAFAFMSKLASCIALPSPHQSDDHHYVIGSPDPVVQISTDAFAGYPFAISAAFGPYASHGIIRKSADAETARWGNVDHESICTSHVERNNNTIRTFMRRCVRKTLCFSKKLASLEHAVAIHLVYFNFRWRPRLLGMTPAQAAGLERNRLSMRALYERVREALPENFP